MTLHKELLEVFPLKHLSVLTSYIGCCSFERDILKGTMKIVQIFLMQYVQLRYIVTIPVSLIGRLQ